MAFTFNDIIYQKANGVARITINRPETYNAFTDVTLREMNQALADASTDRDVGVVVMTGSGRNAFCSGGDVFWEEQGGLERIPFSINERIGQCPKPVIARVNGYAIGAGNHMAYHCDFTIAAEHAIFGQNGARVGSPASGETVSFLSHVVGHKRAREMWFGGRSAGRSRIGHVRVAKWMFDRTGPTPREPGNGRSTGALQADPPGQWTSHPLERG